MSYHPLAEGLIRIGETAIAGGDESGLRAYFAPGYLLHRPDGDLDVPTPIAYFATLRDAFADLKVTRAIIIGEGDYLAARTISSGAFTRPLTRSPAGTLAPTGRAVQWEVMNLFRYDEDGRLAEEWVQSDSRIFVETLTSN